jgi:hypothetical protein
VKLDKEIMEVVDTSETDSKERIKAVYANRGRT